jgi:hypothetical protein
MLISFPTKLDFKALKEAMGKHLNGLIVAHVANGVKAHFVKLKCYKSIVENKLDQHGRFLGWELYQMCLEKGFNFSPH